MLEALELYLHISELPSPFYNYENMVLRETWLIVNILNSKLGLYGFLVYRLD